MVNEPTTAPPASPSLPATQVYWMALTCLVVGLGIGYLFQGMQSPVSAPHTAANATQTSAIANPTSTPSLSSSVSLPGPVSLPGKNETQSSANTPVKAAGNAASAPRTSMAAGRMPTLEEMKQMADKQAAPLLKNLKADPNNSALLLQIGAIYHSTHQFKEAAAYYGMAAQIDPKNVAIRTRLASSLYRNGDVDGAIAQLNQALTYDPKDANALFDLGLIRLQGKQDGRGAVAAWQQLLKTNPQLSADRKATVQKLMADVLTSLSQNQR